MCIFVVFVAFNTYKIRRYSPCQYTHHRPRLFGSGNSKAQNRETWEDTITFFESFHVFSQELDFDAMLMKHVTKQVNDKEGTSNHSSHELHTA